MNNDRNRQNSHDTKRPPLEWVVVKDVTDKDTGLTVRISRADSFRPKFSIQIGKLLIDQRNPKSEPRFVRHLSIFARAENGVVTVGKFHTVLAELLVEAHKFIHEESQKREDEIIDTKLANEKRQLDRDKPKQKPGLKALKKQDAAAAERRKAAEAPIPEAQEVAPVAEDVVAAEAP